MRETPRYMAATHAKRGREAEFEAFVRDVIVPAVGRARPQQVRMWQTLRPAVDQPEGSTHAYVFVFYGESSVDDWDLERLFAEAYPTEEAAGTWSN